MHWITLASAVLAAAATPTGGPAPTPPAAASRVVAPLQDGVESLTEPGYDPSMFRRKQLSDDEKQRRIEDVYANSRTHFPEVAEVTVEQLDRLRQSEHVMLVDVRAPKERAVSIIPGAITSEEVAADPAAFEDKTLVAYCTVGHRSGLFAKQLQARGQRVFNLKGAILAWTHAGRELELDGQPTRRVHVAGPKWSLEASGYEPVW